MHVLAAFIFLATYATAQTKECPPLFLRYSLDHTYCKPPNPTCNILRSSVSSDDISEIVKEHNNLRSKIASGKEIKLPAAANMLQMVWDDELAAVAQRHADQCMFEHDCSNCRRVQNFGVGQNLAIEEITNSPDIPEPNWILAIKSWYDEIAYFPVSAVKSYSPPPPPPSETYGHFTQIIWSESWKIGCGYVLHQESNVITKLYVCNYGPAGNSVPKPTYKAGQACSACPVNSCCDKTCGVKADYPGLCKITDDRGPTYKPQDKYIFYCDFHGQPDCETTINGKNNWLLYNTLSSNYLGIVLKGGEESSIVFNKTMKSSQPNFCFVISYRKGSNVDGEKEANNALETFRITSSNYEVKRDLPNFGGSFKQQFSQFSMTLGWNKETEVKLTFSVPLGNPEQFFEVESLVATEGRCK